MTSRQAAFTLIEVLVALTIVAVAMGAAMRAMGSMTQASGELRLRMMAEWSAENHLASLRLNKTWPTPGTRSTDCAQGTTPLVCVETVMATPNPAFRRIEVAVYADTARTVRLAWLITLQPDPTPGLL